MVSHSSATGPLPAHPKNHPDTLVNSGRFGFHHFCAKVGGPKRAEAEGKAAQGRARGRGAGRGTSPSSPPVPSPSSAAHLVTINPLQSLNELKPAGAPGQMAGGQVHLSLVLAEQSCRGVTSPHACRWGSVPHAGFVRKLHRGNRVQETPIISSAMPWWSLSAKWHVQGRACPAQPHQSLP